MEICFETLNYKKPLISSIYENERLDFKVLQQTKPNGYMSKSANAIRLALDQTPNLEY